MGTMSIASFEARIEQLGKKTSTALLILHRLSLGYTDAEIEEWSGAWKFSRRFIASMLKRTYRVLSLDGLPTDEERLRAAVELYRTFLAALTSRETAMTTRGFYENGQSTSTEPQMKAVKGGSTARLPDINLSRLVKRFDELTPKQHALVKCLAEGLEEDEIVRKLDVSPHSIVPILNGIYTKLGLGSALPNPVRSLYVKAAGQFAARKVDAAEQTMKEAGEAFMRTSAPCAASRSSDEDGPSSAEEMQATPVTEANYRASLPEEEVARVATQLEWLRSEQRKLAVLASSRSPQEVASALGITYQAAYQRIRTLYIKLGFELGRRGESEKCRVILAAALKLTDTAHREAAPPQQEEKRAEEVPVPDAPEHREAPQDQSMPERRSYSPHGIVLTLQDPRNIREIRSVQTARENNGETIKSLGDAGLFPEVAIVQPSTDGGEPQLTIVFIKRDR